MLTYGYTPFLVIKIITTGVGTGWLAAHQQFVLAWNALHALAGVYALLLMYHLLLLLRSIL